MMAHQITYYPCNWYAKTTQQCNLAANTRNTKRLAEAVYEIAKEALGEDKADAILEKHDIKLLN
ncbi:MAG: hypothetical protein CM15mV126_490 [uncultured marine virus]|nr:MAG: hypothetical protein CM15mV126_490 [uncultured marine virus]